MSAALVELLFNYSWVEYVQTAGQSIILSDPGALCSQAVCMLSAVLHKITKFCLKHSSSCYMRRYTVATNTVKVHQHSFTLLFIFRCVKLATTLYQPAAHIPSYADR